ncbi:MAG: methyltransferase domain-containing protein [Rubrivivax sp.]|nr:methyltransferase domain-containing protein [Rubrivivax sp.]
MDHRFEQARAAFMAGVQQHEAGQLAEAEQSFLQAQALVPGRASVVINLAATRLALGRPGPVPDDLAPLLAAEPGHPEALALLARALTALDQPAQALPVLERLLHQRPVDAELQHRRGLLLGRLERADEALSAFDTALALDATHAAAWTQRGSLLREAGRLADARHCFEQALAHGGDPTLNRWFLASVTGAPADGQAPPAYVQALFDGYADGFDQHLVQGLGYSAHQGVVDLLPPGRVYTHALDLGCGTGLCAPPLQGRVQRLTGVDLSPRMLVQARARGLYQALHEAEAVQWLQQTPERFDLALAADVFIYIGDLAPVFAGLWRVLWPGGPVVFSVEAADDTDAVQLCAQLRYRHGETALRRLASAAGFTVEAVQSTVLRHEQGRPIAGLLLRLQKP